MTSSAWSGRTASPTEVSTCRIRPSRSNGCEKTPWTRSASIADSATPAGRGQEHGELVAAEAGHGVRVAHDLLEPARDLDEQLVAAGVPEGVVDLLEAVDVEQHQADRVAGARARGGRAFEALVEQPSVRQPGQRVEQREPRGLRGLAAQRRLAFHTVRNSSSHSRARPATTTSATIRTE